jgi:hypothetical protein
MELMEDGALAFLAAVGITTLVWLIAGLFTRGKKAPRGTMLLLPLHQGAENLEMTVRELETLRDQLGPQFPVLLLDCGLTAQEHHEAEVLIRDWTNVWLGTREELEQRLQ